MNHLRISDWESILVIRAQQGDQDAFEMLADQYRKNLRHVALRVLRNSDDANDAVQETLVKAFRAIGSFNPGRPVLPWLTRICSNCCVDVLRQKKQSDTIEKYEYALTSTDDLEADAVAEVDSALIMRAINRLPRHYRDIVLMRHFRDMEVNEIATALSKPEGTVKSWLFRARAMLRKDLTPVLEAA